MNAATRLASYGAGLAVLVAGGYTLGQQTGHGDPAAWFTQHSGHTALSTHQEGADMNMPSISTGALPQGLAVTENGYTLNVPKTVAAAGKQTVSFQITDASGKPLTDYQKTHEKDLHLIAVRRDFAGFQHVHPRLDTSTGTWSADLDLTPGTWRVFTDFVPPDGRDTVLGSDVLVPGDPGRQTLPAPSRVAALDGYTVKVTGDLVPGHHSMLDFRITKAGRPATNLQPYLGAYGHLVALREGDLDYLHVHPSGEPGDGVTQPGPDIEFGAEVPSPGQYHMFLDFQVDGVVHTAPITLDAKPDTAAKGAGHPTIRHDH